MKSELTGYYAELGVQPDATADEIRDAYRRLAKKYHPDTNRGDKKAEERFKKVSEAYRVLSNPATRLEYHQKESIRTGAKSAAKNSKSGTSFKDVFKQVFRSGFGVESVDAKTRVPKRGKDQKIGLDLDPIDLAQGITKTVQLKRANRCELCGGSGVKPGYDAGQCTICHGLGEIPSSRNGKTVFTSCKNCEGTGRVAKEPCTHCAGTSLQQAVVRVKVQVPAGTNDGQTIRIKGQGSAGAFGGPSGDLLVEVHRINSDLFDIDGSNLLYTQRITLKQAVVGDEIEIPARTGKVKLTLAPGIQPGSTLRIRGKGLKRDDGGSGDLLVKISLILPDKVSNKSKKLLDELMQLPEWKQKNE